jgi:hypothetical protein
MKITKMFPMRGVVNPDTDDFQKWAKNNAHDLHGASVEAANVLALTPSIKSITVANFEWEDEVYADMTFDREEAIEHLENAIVYYVETELYEFAAYAKSVLDVLKPNQK